MAWFGRITRHDTLSETSLQGRTLEGGRQAQRQTEEELEEHQGMDRPWYASAAIAGAQNRPRWRHVTPTENIKEWTDLGMVALP